MYQIISDYKRAYSGFNRNIKLMLVYYVVNSIGNGIVSVLFNLYFLKLGMDENFLGSTVLVQNLIIGVVGVPLGMLADRVPKHKMVKSGFLIMNVFFTLVLFLRNPSLLLAVYAFNSIGLAVASASEFPYICENVPVESRTHLFSINMAVSAAGPSIGMAVGGYLPKAAGALLSIDPESAAAYRGAMLVAQILFWLSGFAAMRLTANSRIEKHAGGPPRLRFKRPAVVLGLCVNTALTGLAISLFGPFMNVILSRRFGLQAHMIGWLFTAQNILISMGALAMPRLGQRRGNLAGFAALQVLTLPLYLLLAFAGNLPVFAVAYVLRGVTANMAAPLFDAYMVSATEPSERGSAAAVLGFSRNLMWAVGGKFGGMLLNRSMLSAPIALGSVSYAAAVAVAVFMVRSPKTREARASDAACAQ